MKSLSCLSFALLFFVSVPSLGLAEGPGSQIEEKARRRAYPGGADEESLVVRDQLSVAPPKVNAKTLQKNYFKTLLKKEEPKTETN